MQKKLKRWMLLIMLALVSFYGCREQDEINHQMVKNDTFFEYSGSNESVAGIVSMMEQKNDSSEYVSTYSKEYGVPLWDESVWLPYDKYSLIVVPVIHKDDEEFQTIWVFCQKGQSADYFTYSKKNELGNYSAYYWMFDYFTQHVLHQMPKSGLIIGSNPNKTKYDAPMVFEYCSVVYTGYMEDGSFVLVDLRENECWTEILWPEHPSSGGGGGTGEAGSGIIPPTGGGGNTTPNNGSTSGDHNNTSYEKTKDFLRENTFETNSLTDDQKNKVKQMYNKIGEDCTGQALLVCLGSIPENNNKFKIEFTDSIDKYSPNNRTIYIRNQGESNEFFHELFHAYQSSFLTNIKFNSRVLNLEIEAHLAQYKFMTRSKENRKKWTGHYKNNLRLRGIARLDLSVDDHGKAIVLEGETQEAAIKRAESAVAESYRMFSIHEKYGTFNGVLNFTLAFNFSNLRNLTKNC